MLFWLSVASSLALIADGVRFIFDHVGTAGSFGVPLAGGSGDAYMSVAGIRDLFAGFLTLVCALLRDRRAVGLCVLLGAIIPAGDGLVALSHSPTPMRFVPIHWGQSPVWC